MPKNNLVGFLPRVTFFPFSLYILSSFLPTQLDFLLHLSSYQGFTVLLLLPLYFFGASSNFLTPPFLFV